MVTSKRVEGYVVEQSDTSNSRPSLVVVMPAFNEAEGIADFIRELDVNLARYRPHFVVIDDCSTDSMAQVLTGLRDSGSVNLHVLRNHQNQGHGLSTMCALSMGIHDGSDLVLSSDGDGQITGSDARMLVDRLTEENALLVEGVRIGRNQSIYRALVTRVTKLLVFLRSGSMPKDANTPFRVYRAEVLESILRDVHIGGLVPNLHISAHVRIRNLRLLEVPIKSIPRRGSDTLGSTWSKKGSVLPSRRFLKFCTEAIIDWRRRAQ